ncbi:MAG: DegT/DnrJ/EryC1/StrS family aminotransferase [Cyclobacteriaceae bacterium]|nr:DegT/DnrJ/EryC1/StrS family aminotransferase [Cyclobacteriaceae bacterium]
MCSDSRDKVRDLIRADIKEKRLRVLSIDFPDIPLILNLFVFADKYELWIIEDACHAPGAYFQDSEKSRSRNKLPI